MAPCDTYSEAAREEIPSARLVADRFQVARHDRDAADQIRKTELQRLKKELPKEKYQELTGRFRAFRKNAKDLNKEERKTLRGFFEYSLCAKQAYDFREELTALYEMNLSKKPAQAKILRWILPVEKSGLSCFDDFSRLLRHGSEEITNFFVRRENRGFVEGFHNKLKVLKRPCYGIFNLKHLFQRLALDRSGYRLFAATTISG